MTTAADRSVSPAPSLPRYGEFLAALLGDRESFFDEVASYLRLTPQTIYKWVLENRIPAVKLGKEWRFRKSIIDRWLDDQILSDESGFSHLRDR